MRSRRASGTSGRSLGVAVSATSVRKILGRLAWRRRRGATRLTPEQLAPILAEALDKYVKWVGGYDVFFDSIGELIDEELPAEESALKAWLLRPAGVRDDKAAASSRHSCSPARGTIDRPR